jgi:hypothetical protein
MNKIEFTKRLIDEDFLLFPCNDDNKPSINMSNFEDEMLAFNIEMKNKIHEKTFDFSQNLAIICGERNGIVVVDVDNELRGKELWELLLKKYNSSNDINTLRIKTPRDGYHYYFQFQKEHFHKFNSIYRPTFKIFGKVGIDLIVENGYVMTPFNSRKNGKMYSIENFNSNLEIREQLNTMPKWLINIFKSTKEAIINELTKK